MQKVPVMSCTDFGSDFVSAYLGNGLIGIRPGANPLLPARTVLSGYVEHTENGFERAAPAPYPLETDIRVNSRSMMEHPEKVTVHGQSLDMATGELVTRLSFEPEPGASSPRVSRSSNAHFHPTALQGLPVCSGCLRPTTRDAALSSCIHRIPQTLSCLNALLAPGRQVPP